MSGGQGDWHRPLVGGACIGGAAGRSGTLGVIVRGPEGLYGLTASHVVDMEDRVWHPSLYALGMPAMEAGAFEIGRVIGLHGESRTARILLTVAALPQTIVGMHRWTRVATPEMAIELARQHAYVWMFGQATGLIQARVRHVDLFGYVTLDLVEDVGGTVSTQRGDSGGAWITADGTLVAIHQEADECTHQPFATLAWLALAGWAGPFDDGDTPLV